MQLVRDRAKTSTLQQQLVWTPVSVQGAEQAKEESPAAGVCTPRLSVCLSFCLGCANGIETGQGCRPQQPYQGLLGITLCFWGAGSAFTGRKHPAMASR